MAYWLAAKERKLVLQQMQERLPSSFSQSHIQFMTRQCFINLAIGALELVKIEAIKENLDQKIKFKAGSRQILEHALAHQKGVLLISAHYSNWELLGIFLAACGYPLNAVMGPSYDPRFTKMVTDFRNNQGIKTILRGQKETRENVKRVLARGEILALLIDQDTRVKGIYVDFLGKLAHTPVSPAQLALKSGAKVVIGFIERLSGGDYQVQIKQLDTIKTTNLENDLQENTHLYNQEISQKIMEQPQQWVWMHRRWKKRPQGSDI